MAVELLRGLKENIPSMFSTREGADRLAKSEVSLGELEREKLALIVEILGHPELDALIDEGKITLGMIKPHADRGKYDLPLTDEQAAEKILAEIGQEKIIFSMALALSRNQAEEFYQPIKEKYPCRIWNSIVSQASSGSLTWMLIYDEGGQAIKWWRERMGSTHPKDASPDSIRGKYAIEENIPNNLVHGSNQTSEVKREIGVLRDALASWGRDQEIFVNTHHTRNT